MLLIFFYTLALIYGVSYLCIAWFFIYHWVKGIPIFEDYPDEDGVFCEARLKSEYSKADVYRYTKAHAKNYYKNVK